MDKPRRDLRALVLLCWKTRKHILLYDERCSSRLHSARHPLGPVLLLAAKPYARPPHIFGFHVEQKTGDRQDDHLRTMNK
jgi:hypothetical protein